MRFALFLAVLPLWAADDANTILQRLVEAQQRNDEKATQYTYVEDAAWFVRDKNGELHQNRSETHEVIFVEGLRYKKLLARNNKPISAKEQVQVEKEMRQTAEERRRHHQVTPSGGRIASGRDVADMGSLGEVLTLFDNRAGGEETKNGRKVWVIECTPAAGREPANQHEKEVLSFSKKFWIDEAENVMLKAVYTVTGEHIFAKPGSVISIEFAKVNDDVWQPSLFVLDIRRGKGNSVVEPRTEYRYSKFQKFNVESTITMDPGK
jgi:hypothetical protein